MANGPTDASLRKVGLAWYAEIPNHCKLYNRNPDTGNVAVAAFSRECVKAITGRSGDDVLNGDDLYKLRRYLVNNVGINEVAADTYIDMARAQIGLDTKPVGKLFDGTTNLGATTIGTIRKDVGEGFHDAADAVGGASEFLSSLLNPMNFVAVAVLVLGGGMVAFGGMRLLRA